MNLMIEVLMFVESLYCLPGIVLTYISTFTTQNTPKKWILLQFLYYSDERSETQRNGRTQSKTAKIQMQRIQPQNHSCTLLYCFSSKIITLATKLMFILCNSGVAVDSSFIWVRKIPWRRKWQPTPLFLPEKSHGQRSLVGYSPWGHRE